MRRAADYVAGLRDGRAVFLDGERVADVTAHPAFAEPIRRIAERYEAGARGSQDVTTCVDPASGRRIGSMWLIPRSAEDLGRRRAVHRFWAEGSYGLMGRTPDHVASVLTGFAGWRQLFDRGGKQFGDNVVRFHARARDEDLYVAYAIVPPQIDRGTPAHRHPEPFLHPGVVRETDARHRDPRGPLDRHVGDHGRLALRELHHPARAGRRGLRDLAGGAGGRGRAAPAPAPALRDASPPASTTTRSPRASTRSTPPWSSTTCWCRGSRSSSTRAWSG